MDKSQVISDSYILPGEGEVTELIMVRVTPFEKEFYEMLSSILSELDIDGNGTKVIKNNSLSQILYV